MSQNRPHARFTFRLVRWPLAAAAAVAGGVAVWVLAVPGDTSRAPADLATGEMAAFQFADDPADYGAVTVTDAAGTQLTLQAAGAGKVTLVNLWATWCAPCVAELPTLDRLQAESGSEDFQVLALSLDRAGPAAAAAFLKEHGVEHLDLYNDKTMRAGVEFGMVGLPVTILLDEDQKEIGRVVGPAEWDAPEVKALINHYTDR